VKLPELEPISPKVKRDLAYAKKDFSTLNCLKKVAKNP